MTAADDGIRGKDSLTVQGGQITVIAGGDGLKADNEEDATQDYVLVEAGALTVTAGGDAITAQTDVQIAGGEFTLTTAGGSSSRIAEAASVKGIKGLARVVIDDGTFAIDAADDAIYSNKAMIGLEQVLVQQSHGEAERQPLAAPVGIVEEGIEVLRQHLSGIVLESAPVILHPGARRGDVNVAAVGQSDSAWESARDAAPQRDLHLVHLAIIVKRQ